MRFWKYLFFLTMTMSMVSSFTAFAADDEFGMMEDEAPSFQNAAQAQHAANMADAFVANSADELADKADKEATSYAEDEATKYIEQKAQDYADAVMQDAAEAAATELIESKVKEYAEKTALEKTGFTKPPEVGDTDEYKEYMAAYEEAKTYAEERAYGDFGEDNNNAYESAVEAWLEDPNNQQVGEDAKAYALERAYGDFGEGNNNAYQTALERFYHEKYEETLTKEIAQLTGATYREIWTMRYVEKKGLGVIAHELGVHPQVLGLGRTKKLKYANKFDVNAPEIENDPELEVDLLDVEIEQVTKRNRYEYNVRNRNQELTKQNGKSKKWIGLTGTSVAAENEVTGTIGGKGKGSNGKNSSSAGVGRSNDKGKSQSSLSAVSEPSGKGKSNNGNKGSRGNSGKSSNASSNKADRGNSSNKGGKGNNGNGKK